MIEAVDRYLEKLERVDECREETLRTARNRLRGMLGPVMSLTVARVSNERMVKLYERRAGEVKTDTHRNELALCGRFFRWCIKQGWCSGDPTKAVTPVGKRTTRKSQLRIDDARRLLDRCLAKADAGDCTGIAVALALMTGMRSGEIEALRVRDVDDNGTQLIIRKAKTEAGVRRVVIPEVLRDRMALYISGRGELEPMWGKPTKRMWLWHKVKKACAEAGIERTTPHGLRGLYASLAIEAGVAIEAVARSLGHAGTSVTRDHYVTPEAMSLARTGRVTRTLTGNN